MSSVVHEEQFHILFATDEELSEAVGEDVLGLSFLLGTDDGHSDGTAESSPD